MNERTTKKVVIDAGHGGEDPGTIANGITEKDYTLKISQYMAKRLSELGIENALTRTSDTTLNSNDRPKKVQSLFGTGNDVIMVSNHINAGGSAISNYKGLNIKNSDIILYVQELEYYVENEERRYFEKLFRRRENKGFR